MAILVHTDLRYEKVDTIEDEKVSALWLKVWKSGLDRKVLVGCVYHPPGLAQPQEIAAIEHSSEVLAKKDVHWVILTADFNKLSKGALSALEALEKNFKLEQVVTFDTTMSSMLDRVYTNLLYCQCEKLNNLPSSDHYSILVKSNIFKDRPPNADFNNGQSSNSRHSEVLLESSRSVPRTKPGQDKTSSYTSSNLNLLPSNDKHRAVAKDAVKNSEVNQEQSTVTKLKEENKQLRPQLDAVKQPTVLRLKQSAQSLTELEEEKKHLRLQLDAAVTKLKKENKQLRLQLEAVEQKTVLRLKESAQSYSASSEPPVIVDLLIGDSIIRDVESRSTKRKVIIHSEARTQGLTTYLKEAESKHHETITLVVGTNDVAANVAVQEFQHEYDIVLTEACRVARSKVHASSILPRADIQGPYVTLYNEVIKKLCEKHDVEYIDNYEKFLCTDRTPIVSTLLLTADGSSCLYRNLGVGES